MLVLISNFGKLGWRLKCRIGARRIGTSVGGTIHKLLIANRGEIACRIQRTARKMGIPTVAVFSEADRNALHVTLADEAICIGPAPSSQSYLCMDKVVEAARRTQANAIHPGYGFLSENAEFADLCSQMGLIFVGPPSNAIRDMGIKNRAKEIMEEAGVPIVSGYHGQEQDASRLLEEANRIGFPVMLKAVRGGGGKGMRIARTAEESQEQLESARREAAKSFGNDDMIVEKFVENPRHVEVQVFGDQLGNYVHLYERDCSVQRRHQKIVEEAPAPGISSEIRRQLGAAAVRAARAVGYVGAGTVEFIMDANHDFFFMEMNTRLQVEHPVTEMITDTDLVEWQLLVAQGEPLPLPEQDTLPLRGHAVEARVYAENPQDGFMPGAGPLTHLRPPDPVLHLRVETGVVEGDQVSVHYDPMIAKIVAWGRNREAALKRLDRALIGYQVAGLATNVEFLRKLIAHPEFQKGNVYTEFIPDHHNSLFPETPEPPSTAVLAQVVAAVLLKETAAVIAQPDFNCNNPFSAIDFFRINLEEQRTLHLETDAGALIELPLTHRRDGTISVQVGEEQVRLKMYLQSADTSGAAVFDMECEVDEAVLKARAVWICGELTLFTDAGSFRFRERMSSWQQEAESGRLGGDGPVAPMPGVIEKILVEPGQTVAIGQPLVIMVAMKMEYVIKAPEAGVVEEVLCLEGDSVAKDAVLVHFQKKEEAAAL